MPDELKPCPFCGSNALDCYISDDTDSSCVSCLDCKASTPPWLDARSAHEHWNTRPVEDALRARLEAAKGLIAAMDEQERLNNVKDTDYSGFLTAFRRTKHKGDVAIARAKWEAVNGQI